MCQSLAVPLAPPRCALPCDAWCQALGAARLLRPRRCWAERSDCLQGRLICPRMTFAFFTTVSHCRFILAPWFAPSPRSLCTAALSVLPACPSDVHQHSTSQMLCSMGLSLSLILLISDLFFYLINFIWTPAYSKHGVMGRKAAANKPKSAV